MNKKNTTRTPKWVVVLILVICIFWIVGPFLFFTYSFVDTNKGHFKQEGDTISIEKDTLTIDQKETTHYDEDHNIYYIEGYLKNHKNKVYHNVTVTYDVYDKNGHILGTAVAYLKRLEANATWKFKAKYEEIDANEITKVVFSDIDYHE